MPQSEKNSDNISTYAIYVSKLHKHMKGYWERRHTNKANPKPEPNFPFKKEKLHNELIFSDEYLHPLLGVLIHVLRKLCVIQGKVQAIYCFSSTSSYTFKNEL